MKSITFSLMVLFVYILMASRSYADKANFGGGKKAEPNLTLKARPSKLFISDIDKMVTLEAIVKKADGSAAPNIDVIFTVIDITNESDGETTDAEGKEYQNVASSLLDLADTYTASASATVEGEPVDDATTFTVSNDDIILVIKQEGWGEVTEVDAGTEVYLEARLKSGNDASGIIFYQLATDPATGSSEWISIPTNPPDPQNPTPEVDKAKSTVSVFAREYEYKAWTGIGANDDSTQTDTAKIKGVFEITKVVIFGFDEAGIEKEGEDRFIIPSGSNPVKFAAIIDPDNAAVRAVGGDFKWSITDLDTFGGPSVDVYDGTPPWRTSQKHASGIGYAEEHTHRPQYSRFKINVLPENQSDFGEKSVKVEIDDENPNTSQDATGEATVRLFYQRTGTGHPTAPGDPTTPNWYYYWSLEDGSGICAYSRVKTNGDSYAEYFDGQYTYQDGDGNDRVENVYGGYDRDSDTVFISSRCIEVDFDFTFPKEGTTGQPGWLQFSIQADAGPDLVNVTYAHEATHRILFDEQLHVGEEDRVPLAWEIAVGSSNLVPASFGDAFDVSANSNSPADDEFYCVVGGAFKFGSFVDGEPEYHGVKALESNVSEDWSSAGPKWNE